MSEYEKMVKKTLWQTAFFLLIAIASLIAVLISAFQLEGHSLKISLLFGVPIMTIAVLIAQNRHSHFSALLMPNTFSTLEFVAILLKYHKYQSASTWGLLLLAALVVLVGVYSSFVS